MAERDYQTARSELIAIYRLEFYKNKKNWKLCSDRKPPPPLPLSPKSKCAFNQTYDVQLDADLDTEPPLNQAFLNEVPVDESYPEPYHEPLLGTPAQAPDFGQAWPGQQWMEPEVGDQQEWCGGDAEGAPADAAYDTCDAPALPTLWPTEQCSGPEWAGLHQLELASPAQLLALAEDWLQRQGFHEDREQVSYCDQYPLDSDSTEFVRGAHLAPHSSETDLSLIHDDCPCVSVQSLRTASASRLCRALVPHAAALREILRELADRDHTRPPSPYLTQNHFEERPTRDTDPPHAHERLLAASRQPTPTPTPIHMPTHMQMQMPTSTPIHMPTHMQMQMPTSTPIHMPTHMQMQMPTSTPIHMPTHMQMQMPTSTPIHMPTHMQMQMPTPAGPPSVGRGRGRGRLIGLNMGRPYRL